MTTMKTNDGSQYVLVLTKEQAELLGTFRFSHVGRSPLYEVLRDLPHKMGARFRTEVEPFNGKPIFHELIPAGVGGLRRGEMLTQPIARPSGGKSMLGDDFALLEALVLASLLEGRVQPMVPGPMQDNIQRSPEPEKPEPKKWIVQFNDYNGWVSCVGNGCCANSEYISRNEAYRQMRARIKKYGTQPGSYRVVPKGTAAGPERDRGYYTVEFFTKIGRPLGWNTSANLFLRDTFPSADGARLAINTHAEISLRHRYRVKWHPSRT